MQKNKQIEAPTLQKIRYMSNNLMRLRTKLILMKYKISGEPESIERFLVEQDYELLDKVVSEAEMECGVLKFVWFNLKK
jgi:hypothetical protein